MASQSLIIKLSGDASSFKSATDAANSALDKLGKKADSVSASLSSIGNTLTLSVTAPIVAMGAGVIKAAADLDALKRGLLAVSPSAAEASKQFERLREVAKLPGLGLNEAIQASVQLQAVGRSGEEAARILRTFGNALATVGRGKEDLNEVIRQLTQLGTRGVVTADNLKPIIERVPQVAAIIKENFGPEALGNPAETFKKLGVSSEELIQVLVRELGKLPEVTGGAKNAFDNLRDTIQISAARIGEHFLPAVERAIPKLEAIATAAADAFVAFTKLPDEVQNMALAFTAAAVAAGPLIRIFGELNDATSALRIALAAPSTGLIAVIGTAFVLALGQTYTAVQRLEERLKLLREEKARLAKGEEDLIKGQEASTLATEKAAESTNKWGIDLKALDPLVRQKTESTNKDSAATDGLVQAETKLLQVRNHLRPLTLEMAIFHERMAQAKSRDAERTKELSKITEEYGESTVKAAIARAQLLGLLYQELETPPEMPTAAIKVPTYTPPTLPKGSAPGIPGGTGGNIGDQGMLTQERYDELERTAKRYGREQSKAMQQVSLVFTDLSRGITKVIFEGGKLGDVMKRVAMEAAQSITRLLIEGALKKLTESLLNVGGLFGKIFGGGTGMIMNAAGSGGGGGVAKTASILGAGLSGAVGVVSGVVSAVSGVISNFQLARQENTLNAIEESTRYTKIWTGEQSQSILWSTQKTAEYLGYLNKSVDLIGRMLSEMLALSQQRTATAGGYSFDFRGATFGAAFDQDQFAKNLVRTLKNNGF